MISHVLIFFNLANSAQWPHTMYFFLSNQGLLGEFLVQKLQRHNHSIFQGKIFYELTYANFLAAAHFVAAKLAEVNLVLAPKFPL